MEDLTIISLFLIQVLSAVLIAIAFALRCHFLIQYNRLIQEQTNILQKKDLPIYHSIPAVRTQALQKIFHLKPTRYTVLQRLATKNIRMAQKLIHHQIKITPENFLLLLLDAKISLLTNDRKRFQHLMDNIQKPYFLMAGHRAEYLYLCAENELYQTDMQSAAAHTSNALKIYKKRHDDYNTALCYQTLSKIYRISGLFDIATTLSTEARQIYDKLKISAKSAEVEAECGLIEIGRENIKIAREYFNSAAKICQENNFHETESNIKNWQGLTFYLEKSYTNASKLFKDVLKVSSEPPAKSYAAEMLARIEIQKKQYDKAQSYADTAILYAKQQDLTPNLFENLYLKAEIYYIRQDYTKSRQILTELIKQKTPPSTIYYPANAYTLLGMVELKENHLDKAHTLFKQALDLEHSNNRLKGAAIDYNNLAELSRLTGNISEARTYLEQALHYAQEIDDEDLIKYLKTKL